MLAPLVPRDPCPISFWTSARSTGPSARRMRSRFVPASICLALGSPLRADSQRSRRRRRTAAEKRHQSSGVTRWIVARSSVPWTTVRRSSARVSFSRSNPSSLVHSPTYIEGEYWAWMPPIRSSARGKGRRFRSSSICRASSARFSSAVLRTRSVSAIPPEA